MAHIEIPAWGSADELFVSIFKDFFKGQAVGISTTFYEGMSTPHIITRRERRSGTQGLGTDDERFLRSAVMNVNVLCSGIDADEDAEELSEMCYRALLEARLNQKVIYGHGHIVDLQNSSTIARESDWATSTGVVQYASLPKGTVRYETIYRVLFRPPVAGATNKFAPLP